jgi:hypothetical protein
MTPATVFVTVSKNFVFVIVATFLESWAVSIEGRGWIFSSPGVAFRLALALLNPILNHFNHICNHFI